MKDRRSFRVMTSEELDMAHKTLLCLKNAETEFGLFCAGCHGMFLSLFGKVIDAKEFYPVVDREIPVLCAIADSIYDWFEELKRTEAIQEDKLKRNHKIGETVLSIVLRAREQERKKGEEE